MRSYQIYESEHTSHLNGLGYADMFLDWLTVLIALAVLGSGLIAGAFFAFSTFVMRALARLPADQSIAAMQSINAEVLKSLFMAVFFGTAALGAVLGITAVLRWGEPGMPALFAGGVLYLAGVLLGTLRGNVPLNKELAAANPGGASGADTWVRYLRRWGRWNHLRTLAAALACAAFIGALAPLGPGW